MKKKLITSLSVLVLLLSISGCNQTTSEEDNKEETTSISDYTLSFSFLENGKATSLPSYATAYIIGDWDNWTNFLELEQTGLNTYTYVFSSIDTGIHEYKGVMWYTYEKVSWDNCKEIITSDEGGNATLTISSDDEGYQLVSEELRVTQLANYQNPDEMFASIARTSNYKGTYADITYVSTVGATYGEYLEDSSVLHTDQVLASREISSYTYYEAYFTSDAVVVSELMVSEYGTSNMYFVYLNDNENDQFYLFADYGYGSGYTSYYGSPFYQGWNDNYNSLFWASTYSDIYFKLDHSELINDKYTEVYTQSNNSASLYFQVFGVDLMMQSNYSAQYLASYFTHEYSYFIPEEETLYSDYHAYDISWDYAKDGYNSTYTGPSSEDATVYLKDEEGLLVVDEIGEIDEEALLEYARGVYDSVIGGAAG